MPDGGSAAGGASARIGVTAAGAAACRVGRAVRDGEGDGNRPPFGVCGDFADAGEETLLHPLQDEAVLREEPVPAGDAFEGQRANPGVELLGRQFLAEGVEAALPE